jgi:hypothetical protein
VKTTSQLFHPIVGRNQEKMGRHSIITKDDVLRAVRMFRWVTRSTLELYFAGSERRMKVLELLLPTLEQGGQLFSEWHRGEKVYSIARKERVKPVSMDHEIACADILVRLWRCRMKESEIFTERVFRGFGIVPEGGIRYSAERGTMLIFEYCTRSNFTHGGVMKSKITRYQKYLPQMEAKVKRSITVLFVLDIDRNRVEEFIRRMGQLLNEPVLSGFVGSLKREVGSVADGGASALYVGDRFPFYPFFFTDYQTFKSVPVGEALTAKIYFWNDGKKWRLTEND